MADKKTAENKDKITSTVARESDGTVQINFTIPFALIKKAKEDTVAEMAKDIEIPGFRKGKAPLKKAAEKMSENSIIEHALSHILPQALANSINENKIKVAVYPKFELVKANDNEEWQVRGITCELPEVSLNGYKEAITGALRAKNIVVPGKDAPKELSKDEKEQVVIRALLDTVKLTIPKILIEEEVTSRLSNLLARIEKLGLDFENYLKSIGKTVEGLREDYEVQSKDAIALDLILSQISQEENLTVGEAEVDAALNMSTASTSQQVESKEDLESRKRMIKSILLRRQALDHLLALA